MRIVYERAAVRVPATTANMGPGFDSFGMAFRYYDEVSVRPITGTTRVIVEGVGAETVPTDDDNLVVQALRAGLDAVGAPHAVHAPGFHAHVPVGDPRQPRQAVLGDQHRAPRLLRARHESRHVRHSRQIEVARRLVQQQIRGAHCPKTRERHLLPLPSRKAEKVAPRQGAHAQLLESGTNALADVLRGPARVLQGECDLPSGVGAEELGARILEQRTRPLGDLPRLQGVHGPAVEADASVRGSGEEPGRQTPGQAQCGRLAAPRAPAQHNHLAGAHRQRHVHGPGAPLVDLRAVGERGVVELDHASARRANEPTAVAPKTASTA